MSSERGSFIHAESSEFPIPIKVEKFGKTEVRDGGWSWEDWQKPLMDRGKNTAKIYDLYAEGRTAEAGVADFADAVKRHIQLDEMLY